MPPTSRPQKTAVLLAQQIVADIHRRGNLVGDRLPAEHSMLEQYQVGRGTLREALRYLELQGVISMRPGPGGGPIVQGPNADSLATSLTLLLQFANAPFRTIVEARAGLEPMTAELAAQRMTAPEIEALQSSVELMQRNLSDQYIFLQENKRFHEMIARGSGNAIFCYLAEALVGISDGSAIGIDYPEVRRNAVHEAHQRIYEAIASRDSSAAAGAMADHLRQYLRYAARNFPGVLAAPITWPANAARSQDSPRGRDD